MNGLLTPKEMLVSSLLYGEGEARGPRYPGLLDAADFIDRFRIPGMDEPILGGATNVMRKMAWDEKPSYLENAFAAMDVPGSPTSLVDNLIPAGALGAMSRVPSGFKGPVKMESISLTPREGFDKFFGFSKVRDEGGPITVYHQTDKLFDDFVPGGLKKIDNPFLDDTMSGHGIWFAGKSTRERLPTAHNVRPNSPGARVIEGNIRIERPLLLDDLTMMDWAKEVYAERGNKDGFPFLLTKREIKALKADGYDGIIWDQGKGVDTEYIIFDPDQFRYLRE